MYDLIVKRIGISLTLRIKYRKRGRNDGGGGARSHLGKGIVLATVLIMVPAKSPVTASFSLGDSATFDTLSTTSFLGCVN